MSFTLLEDFFTELSSTYTNQAGEFTSSIRLNALHPVYKGHFELLPIAPGVCLTQVIQEILMSKLRKNLMLVSGDNIKFLAMINPRENADFSIQFLIKQQDDLLDVTASYSHNGLTYLKFRGKFKTRN